jgi:ParB-like chromosome segregation protein Spo0J
MKNLILHPLNEKIYGAQKPDSELVESVRQHGVLNPILIDRKKQILSGNRRFLAAQQVGRKEIPAIVFAGTETEAELILIESNRQRIKTQDQRNREAVELLRIEKELAKDRQSRGGQEKVPQVLGEAGEAIAKVAKRLGESAETTRRRIAIVEAGITQGERSVERVYREEVKQKKKQQKTETQIRVFELQKLFYKKVELQASKDKGRFNLFFYKQTEAQIREIAKALA